MSTYIQLLQLVPLACLQPGNWEFLDVQKAEGRALCYLHAISHSGGKRRLPEGLDPSAQAEVPWKRLCFSSPSLCSIGHRLSLDFDFTLLIATEHLYFLFSLLGSKHLIQITLPFEQNEAWGKGNKRLNLALKSFLCSINYKLIETRAKTGL